MGNDMNSDDSNELVTYTTPIGAPLLTGLVCSMFRQSENEGDDNVQSASNETKWYNSYVNLFRCSKRLYGKNQKSICLVLGRSMSAIEKLCVGGDATKQHWALFFIFPNEDIVLIELTYDENKIIKPNIISEAKLDQMDEFHVKKRYHHSKSFEKDDEEDNKPKESWNCIRAFYPIGIGKEEAIELALENELNEELYHASKKNCQIWATNCVRKLGFEDIAQELEELYLQKHDWFSATFAPFVQFVKKFGS